jgi:hypothetical protein
MTPNSTAFGKKTMEIALHQGGGSEENRLGLSPEKVAGR